MTPWRWAVIDRILARVDWTRDDLNELSKDVYGHYRPFECLDLNEGKVLLRSLLDLGNFKEWRRNYENRR